MLGYRVTMFYKLCCVCYFLATLVLGAQGLSSCGPVAEVFARRVGLAGNLPVTPISDASLTECHNTLAHTKGTSCCTAGMESQFLLASTDYLRDHIRTSNSKLRARITQSLHLYRDHLRQSVQEAYNKTSDTLTKLYKIPTNVHKSALDSFFGNLNTYLMGSHEFSLHNIINGLFTNLFPIVFNNVLSDPAKHKHPSHEFNKCLLKHYEDMQPFGNIPAHLGKRMNNGFHRARIYTESLDVMIRTIDSVDNLNLHSDCKKAITRLQFCSMCSSQLEVKPCRGLCLNVMRGCLSGISEISTSWDDLVVGFENLQRGMFKHNVQELLSFLDANITDALLQAMDDGPRIFTRVMDLCRESSQTMADTELYKKLLTPQGLLVLHPNRINSIRKDISSLYSQLEESLGFLQRLADGLCRAPGIYDQEMQSDRCWNGSTLGRYIREVPEANVISQATHNMEVRITLIPDSGLVKVKDTLVHMKKNLSVLYQEELMMSDQSYKTVVSSGGGYGAGRDVIIDDEDFVDKNSGSGSGAGSDDDDDDEDVRHTGDKSTFTTRPISDGGRGHGSLPPSWSGGSGGNDRTGDGRDKNNRGGHRGSAVAVTTSFTLLFACVIITSLHL